MRKRIPSNIKQEVRQKCNFGCIICGCPVYDYEHLVDYHIVKEHKVDNIFLLCPICHRKKTNKEINKEYILDCYNKLNRLTTKPEKIIQGTNELVLGNNIIKNNTGYLFKIFERDYFKIMDNQLFAQLYNNDKLVFSISNNEYKIHRDIWDVNYSGGVLEFRNAPRHVLFRIHFSSENIKLTGVFIINKNKIEIKENGIFVNNLLFTSNCIVTQSNYSGFLIDKKINKSVCFLNCTNMNSCSSYLSDVGFGIEIKKPNNCFNLTRLCHDSC